MSHPLRLGLFSLLGVGLAGSLLLTFLLATEQGLQLLWRQAEGLLPPGLSVNRVEGRIRGPLTIQGLRYENENLRLEIDNLHLQWQPAKLVGGTLWLNRLELQGLRYSALQTTPDETEAFSLPESIRLPIRLVVQELSLQNGAYSQTPEAEPLTLHTARLSAEVSQRQWSLSGIRVDAPLLQLEGELGLQVEQDFPIQGQTRWQLRPAGYPPLVGSTQLQGSLRELLVSQTLAPPYNSNIELTLTDPIEELRFSVRWMQEEIDLQALNKALPAVKIRGAVTASGDLTEGSIGAEMNILDPALGEFQAAFDGRFNDQSLEIDDLRLSPAGQPGFIAARGRILIREQRPALELRAAWEELGWPLQGPPRVRSPEGRGEIAGDVESYAFSLGARLEIPERTAGRIELEGQGNREALRLDSILVNALGGELSGHGDLSWHPNIEARLKLSGQGLNPGTLLPQWPGELALQLETEAELQQGRLLTRGNRLDVSGELRGYPLRFSAKGDLEEQGLRLAAASLTSGATTLSANGLVGETLDLQWQIQSSDLTSLLPDAAGRLRGGGAARGALATPRLEAVLTGDGLKYGAHLLHHLKLETDLDLSGKGESHLLLQVTDGSLAETRVDRLRLAGKGRPGAHELQLDASTSRGEAALEINGELGDERWQFQVGPARLKYPGLAAWTLKSPSNGWISRDLEQLSLAQNCWISEPAVLCVSGGRSPTRWQGQFDLRNLSVAYFDPWLPPGVQVQGSVSGQGQLLQPASAAGTQVTVRIETSDGALFSSAENEEQVKLLSFQPGEMRMELAQQEMALEVDLPFTRGGGIEMKARLLPGIQPLPERAVSGTLDLRLPDIAVIGELLPDVGRTEGRLEGTATLSGTPAAPRFRGRLLLTDGAAELSGPGIALSDIELDLSGRDQGDIEISASANSGPGSVRAKGRAKIGAEGMVTDLVVSGNAFQLLDLPEARVLVSPDLKLSMNATETLVEGEVKVPHARIKLKSLPKSAVAVSPDQVIIDPAAEAEMKPAEARRIDARLRVILGDDVRFDGLGLKAKLAGNLLLIEKPGRPTTASGSVDLSEGTYKAYGQNMAIERGRLRYAGGLVSDPGLDVRAVRRPAEGIAVGVEARGTLKKPRFTLFSEPAMSQSEQLSYLVLGRPLEGGTSSEEGNAMNQAAMALGLAGGGAVADQFGERFGVDTVDIKSGPNESTDEAALVVGKYLSPKLYVGYGVGLFDPVSTIWLRYSISSNWRLVTETSTESSGADIYYTIDRGR